MNSNQALVLFLDAVVFDRRRLLSSDVNQSLGEVAIQSLHFALVDSYYSWDS